MLSLSSHHSPTPGAVNPPTKTTLYSVSFCSYSSIEMTKLKRSHLTPENHGSRHWQVVRSYHLVPYGPQPKEGRRELTCLHRTSEVICQSSRVNLRVLLESDVADEDDP